MTQRKHSLDLHVENMQTGKENIDFMPDGTPVHVLWKMRSVECTRLIQTQRKIVTALSEAYILFITRNEENRSLYANELLHLDRLLDLQLLAKMTFQALSVVNTQVDQAFHHSDWNVSFYNFANDDFVLGNIHEEDYKRLRAPSSSCEE